MIRQFLVAGGASRLLCAGAVAGCGDLAGFGGDVPPLTTFQFEVTGDLASVRPAGAEAATLRVSVVWGAQWLVEPMCFLPPESDAVAAAVAAGCRSPFAFTPDRVAAGIEVELNVPVALPVFDLPAPDVMVGDVTARVGYASLVVYDDRDGSGTLELARPPRTANGGFDPGPDDELPVRDIVYGASFVAMTEPDVRIAFREGRFNDGAAFYPRSGCGAPMPGFSIVAAGGFSATDALAAAAAGRLPAQDPATCAERYPDDTVVPIPLRPPEEVSEVRCAQRRASGRVRYRQPPAGSIDFAGRTWACASIPSFGGGSTAGIVQLLVSTRAGEPCKGLTHYTLRGCDEGELECAIPEWDFTATPPSWWPCSPQAPR